MKYLTRDHALNKQSLNNPKFFPLNFVCVCFDLSKSRNDGRPKAIVAEV